MHYIRTSPDDKVLIPAYNCAHSPPFVKFDALVSSGPSSFEKMRVSNDAPPSDSGDPHKYCEVTEPMQASDSLTSLARSTPLPADPSENPLSPKTRRRTAPFWVIALATLASLICHSNAANGQDIDDDERGCSTNDPNVALYDRGVFCFMAGQAYEKSGQFPTALLEFSQACDKGVAVGCFNAAVLYHEGKGVNQDFAKAAGLFERACWSDDADSCNNLGAQYANGQGVKQDISRAAELYKKACTAGLAMACNNLNALNAAIEAATAPPPPAPAGDPTPNQPSANDLDAIGRKNLVEYLKNCESSVIEKSKSAQACLSAGYCYSNGIDPASGAFMTKDFAIAVHDFETACIRGSGLGCFEVGTDYEEGKGSMKQDYSRAADYYRKACNFGYNTGCNNLASLYAAGQGVKQDLTQAAALYRKSCNGGNGTGCTNLKALSAPAKTVASSQATSSPAPGANPDPSHKTIKDPAEYNDYMNTLYLRDDQARANALDVFVARYPNSVMKDTALEEEMRVYDKLNNAAKAVQCAKRLLALDPDRIPALVVMVDFERYTFKAGDAQTLSQLASQAQRGLNALAAWKKPEDLKYANFAKARDSYSVVFWGAAGFAKLQARDFAAARENYLQSVRINPTNLADVYQLGIACLEMKQVDPAGFWYIARAFNLNKGNAAGAEVIGNYGVTKYRSYHGSDDGWEALLTATANQTAPPEGFTVTQIGAKATSQTGSAGPATASLTTTGAQQQTPGQSNPGSSTTNAPSAPSPGDDDKAGGRKWLERNQAALQQTYNEIAKQNGWDKDPASVSSPRAKSNSPGQSARNSAPPPAPAAKGGASNTPKTSPATAPQRQTPGQTRTGSSSGANQDHAQDEDLLKQADNLLRAAGLIGAKVTSPSSSGSTADTPPPTTAAQQPTSSEPYSTQLDEMRSKASIWDMFNGTTIGAAHGISYAPYRNRTAAAFSRANDSRIQYQTGIPKEGTLEWRIEVDNGYFYDNAKLMDNQPCAQIFTTDVQGGDVTWPGSTWLTVCDNGDITLDMAQQKFDPNHQVLKAAGTKFRFHEFHTVAISFGSKGQAIFVDSIVAAADPTHSQTLGAGGTRDAPVDLPTIGQSVPSVWPVHSWEGGFEGSVSFFYASNEQMAW